jgi:hypothetical protein
MFWEAEKLSFVSFSELLESRRLKTSSKNIFREASKAAIKQTGPQG